VYQVFVESPGNEILDIAVWDWRRDLFDAGDLQHQIKVCR
jgi:hypothetical protein